MVSMRVGREASVIWFCSVLVLSVLVLQLSTYSQSEWLLCLYAVLRERMCCCSPYRNR